MRSTILAAGTLLAFTLSAAPALAQDETAPPPAVTVSGSLTGVSDYRLRGVSQTDKQIAVQGALTIAHESGFYIAGFASNLAGWGTFGGANVELDGILGYKRSFGSATVDAGVTWYTYPGGFAESDVVEFFGKLSGTAGPANLTAGVFYAPKQTSLSRFFRSGAEAAAGTTIAYKRYDNLYLSGDGTVGVPGTPVTAKAHIGWSKGNDGLGPNGTSLAPTGEYFDWLVGADVAVYKNLTLGVAYVDTDIGEGESAYLAPNFRESTDGSSISNGTILVSLTAAF
jgi:hypothetical protein